MSDILSALEARLRGLVAGSDLGSPLTLSDLADLIADARADEERSVAEPASFWIGPFAHNGGGMPVPPETVVRTTAMDGTILDYPARCVVWTNRSNPIISLSYRADNAEGWLDLPRGWSIPDPPTLGHEIRGGRIRFLPDVAPELPAFPAGWTMRHSDLMDPSGRVVLHGSGRHHYPDAEILQAVTAWLARTPR